MTVVFSRPLDGQGQSSPVPQGGVGPGGVSGGVGPGGMGPGGVGGPRNVR